LTPKCVVFSFLFFSDNPCPCLACLQGGTVVNRFCPAAEQGGSGVSVTEEQLFEYERFMPLAGWSSRHLLPTERNRYSRQEDGMHSTNNFPQIRLPEGELVPVESAVAKNV